MIIRIIDFQEGSDDGDKDDDDEMSDFDLDDDDNEDISGRPNPLFYWSFQHAKSKNDISF